MEELTPINSFLFNQPSSSYSLVFKGHCKSFRSLETDFGYYLMLFNEVVPFPPPHTHTDIITKSILHSLISSFPLFSSGQFLLLLLYHLFIEIALIHKQHFFQRKTVNSERDFTLGTVFRSAFSGAVFPVSALEAEGRLQVSTVNAFHIHLQGLLLLPQPQGKSLFTCSSALSACSSAQCTGSEATDTALAFFP